MADMRNIELVSGTPTYRGFSARTFISKASFSRPNDAIQYTAGDIVSGGTPGTALNFGTCAINNGGGGLAIDAVMRCSVNQSTKPNYRMYLFSGSPTLAGDNLAWAPGTADLDNIVAMADFSSWEVGGTGSGTAGNCFSFATINKGYRCAAGAANLWGAVVERSTYTPLANEAYTISIKVNPD